jgi:hypothetical protein
MITGTFYKKEDADNAVRRLHDLGYTDGEISVMMSPETHDRHFSIERGTKTGEGAAAGGAIGGAITAIAAGLTAVGGIATVGTGGAAFPLVVGPLAAALAGLGAGGLVGGIIGALVGTGIPEMRAREIETELRRGGIVVGVTPRAAQRERVAEVLSSRGGTVRTETGQIPTRETRERVE